MIIILQVTLFNTLKKCIKIVKVIDMNDKILHKEKMNGYNEIIGVISFDKLSKLFYNY